MARLVVVDAVGEPLVLSAYSDNGAVVTVPMTPIRALALAADLLEAARRRLSETAEVVWPPGIEPVPEPSA
jgi:hypothetical protein